jgi:hypothetical protein
MKLVDVKLPSGARLTVTDIGAEYQVGVTLPGGPSFSTRRPNPEEAIAAGEQWLLDIGHPTVAVLLGAAARAELRR